MPKRGAQGLLYGVGFGTAKKTRLRVESTLSSFEPLATNSKE
jgi:hypothetical protein